MHYFKTGDLVFRRGVGFIPFVIRQLTRSKWSHVVICINTEWVLEADHERGVRLIPLEEFLSDPKQVYGYRQWNGCQVDKDVSKGVMERFIGRGYESSWLDLLGSAFRLFDDRELDDRTLFCSELVAIYLQELEILSRNRLADSFTPEDFASKRLNTNKGYYSKTKFLK